MTLVLAERVRGAQLRLWPDVAHMYMIGEPRVDPEIAAFLLDHTAAQSAPDIAGAA
jgi:hypothetical protein